MISRLNYSYANGLRYMRKAYKLSFQLFCFYLLPAKKESLFKLRHCGRVLLRRVLRFCRKTYMAVHSQRNSFSTNSRVLFVFIIISFLSRLGRRNLVGNS